MCFLAHYTASPPQKRSEPPDEIKNVKNLIVAGGVAANKGLREKLTELCQKEDVNLTVPSIKYCTDNAVMIGAAGYYAYKLGRISDLNLNATATDKLN